MLESVGEVWELSRQEGWWKGVGMAAKIGCKGEACP